MNIQTVERLHQVASVAREKRVVVELIVQPSGAVQWQVTCGARTVGISKNGKHALQAINSLVSLYIPT